MDSSINRSAPGESPEIKVGFDREVAIYRRFQRSGVEVTFVTHGDARDLTYSERLPGIRILCNRWGLPGKVYRPLLLRLHRQGLAGADVIKTNQMLGAELALSAARRLDKPLVARCGFMLSKNLILERGADSREARRALALESRVFKAAARVVVTTEAMRESIVERFPDLVDRVAVIPNCVDTDLFRPTESPPAAVPRLVFVGRLSPEKNLPALIEAVRSLDVDLDLIGQGPLREELVSLAEDKPRVRFLGPVPNRDLPSHLRSATAFIQPSLYEGHPKTIVEAMACGLPIIATDVSGIADTVRHGDTAHLCQTDSDSIRSAIQVVLADGDLRGRLGRSAREFAVAHFSLEKITDRELALLRDVTDKSLRS
jgi:glycosyltransferase involved in cell wall biosynthesis